MDPLKLIGEGIGLIAIIEGFMIYYSSTRERILLFKFISDALWFFNLVLLGGYTGALLNLIAMGRETVFYFRDKKKWASTPLWLAVFLFITAASPVFSLISGREGWYALFPAAGSMLGVIAFYQKKPAATRAVGFFSQALWLIYACFIRNYSSAVCNAVLLASAVAGTVRAGVKNKP
ncbi:MAG: YgjV family protein [Clostridia bacterium]|nr:YgjV family protein [Clostridia bacterium]